MSRTRQPASFTARTMFDLKTGMYRGRQVMKVKERF
jgi:hypothetical protein